MDNTIDLIKELEERINLALSIIDNEQERLDIIISSFNMSDISFDKKYVIYNMMSSKTSIEYIKSVLTGEPPDYGVKKELNDE